MLNKGFRSVKSTKEGCCSDGTQHLLVAWQLVLATALSCWCGRRMPSTGPALPDQGSACCIAEVQASCPCTYHNHITHLNMQECRGCQQARL